VIVTNDRSGRMLSPQTSSSSRHAPDDHMLTVTVRDYGRFLSPSLHRLDRGRGTALMRDLTIDFTRDSTSQGTTVRFRLPLADRAST
jgi:hypothetical protein